MTDRPILFSAPMVRALLDGRKTQTRRVLKPQPGPQVAGAAQVEGAWAWRNGWDGSLEGRVALPFAAGDRLYVRETWSGVHHLRDTKPSDRESFIGDGIPYLRDELWYWVDGEPGSGDWERPRPGIHMPRWASRLTLTVTDVRVERVQEVSDTDAMAEGMRDQMSPEPVEAFRRLWDDLNGARGHGWDANPWVTVTSFTVERGNIDAKGGDHGRA